MPSPDRRRASRGGLILLAALAAVRTGSARGQDGPPDPSGRIVLREALVLPPVGSGGRVAVPVDPLAARIAAGTWSPPREGDAFPLPDGRSRQWEAARADDDGVFRHPALRGGSAFVSVDSDADRVMILEASGHGSVLVEGEPRVGDPYGLGYVRLPILLKRGATGLLFGGGRGTLRAGLLPPKGPASLDPADATLPDLVVGRPVEDWAAVVVVNATTQTRTGLMLRAEMPGGPAVEVPVPPLPPLATRKVGVRLEGPAPSAEGDIALALTLALALADAGPDAMPLDVAAVTLNVRRPEQAHKRTFRSAIDGSVQYYGVVPAGGGPSEARPGLILTLHGASVEGIGQARVYAPKPFAHVVAPTNRRPYGFDWEDWGRLDALEVLGLASDELDADPRRTYLTGHSMGGHGTWHLGVSYPDRFAAIAPSAGWISMTSYAGARGDADPSPMAALFRRASSPSDTTALAGNLEPIGVYVLHGDRDDNVPVGQARAMREHLGRFHPDFSYYERPGAGHWWGDQCCDWPPLIDFLARRSLPDRADVRRVAFRTASPGVSSRAHWAEVLDQVRPMAWSEVRLDADPAMRRVSGTTENVSLLALDVPHLPPDGPIAVTLDGQEFADLAHPADGSRLYFERTGDAWNVARAPAPGRKGPRRYGPFKEAFRNHVEFVYGTRGSPEETARTLAKARYDAEVFWYRGNASVDVVPDSAFDPGAEPDRNVILYGNADTNAAWAPLVGDGPVRVERGRVRIEDRTFEGADLALLAIRPRPGSDRASVGLVAGTGPAGMRLADRLPYFVSGVAYPDCVVLGPEALTEGLAGVLAAGFFGSDWGVPSGDFTWRD